MYALFFMYVLALVLSVVMVAQGNLELGVIGTFLVLTMAPIALLVATERARWRRGTEQRLEDLQRTVRTLADQAALSNDARRVLNRAGERELLVRAIEEDIGNRNWDAALVLIRELADGFGYRAEAEELRARIDEERRQTVDRDINDAVAYLDGLILQRRWDAAYADAARIARLYPESARIDGLRARVEQARGACKQDLERRFFLAAHEGRHDEALTLLKELDFYLSPSEAEPLRELARGVIGKARENRGAQVKLAVQDRRWGEAVRLGEGIITEFPNSRMAAEVRNVIESIKQRASLPTS